jgi:hypothetical protein
VEPPDLDLYAFYEKLLLCLRRPETHQGTWHLCYPRPAWEDNGSFEQFIVFAWVGEEQQMLVTVNYGPSQAQCYVPVRMPRLEGRKVLLMDMLRDARYERVGDVINDVGLFLDMPGWGYHVFDVR